MKVTISLISLTFEKPTPRKAKSPTEPTQPTRSGFTKTTSKHIIANILAKVK